MGISTSTGTLAAGTSRTFDLAPASTVTLTLPPNCRVTITESPATVAATSLGGNATRVHKPRLPGTFTYGPYPMGGSVVVENESNSGSTVSWVETSADSGGKSFGGNPYFAQVTGTTANQYVQLCDIGPNGLDLKPGDSLEIFLYAGGNATSGAKSVGLCWGSVGSDAGATAYSATSGISGTNYSGVFKNTLHVVSDTIFIAHSSLATTYGNMTNAVTQRTYDPATTGKIFVRLGLAVGTDTLTLHCANYRVARA